MKFKSALVTQVSGSVGGMTGSHNQGGMYFRGRGIPTNPQSQYQLAVRNALRTLTAEWSGTLTDAQRAAWTTYAANVPIIDRLGDARTIPPLAMFVRSNVSRIQAGLDPVDDGPTVMALPAHGAVSYDVTAGSPATASVTFDTNADWANEDGGALLVYASRQQAQTINYFKGPYRYAGRVDGSSSEAPTSPATITLPFAGSEDNRIHLFSRVSRADGRLSATFPVPAAVGAA